MGEGERVRETKPPKALLGAGHSGPEESLVEKLVKVKNAVLVSQWFYLYLWDSEPNPR